MILKTLENKKNIFFETGVNFTPKNVKKRVNDTKKAINAFTLLYTKL